MNEPRTILEQRMRDAGMNIGQLSRAAGYDLRNMKRLVHGDRPVDGLTLAVAIRIADALRIKDLRNLTK